MTDQTIEPAGHSRVSTPPVGPGSGLDELLSQQRPRPKDKVLVSPNQPRQRFQRDGCHNQINHCSSKTSSRRAGDELNNTDIWRFFRLENEW